MYVLSVRMSLEEHHKNAIEGVVSSSGYYNYSLIMAGRFNILFTISDIHISNC